MSELRHFILVHEGDLAPEQLRAFAASRDPALVECDIFDFRSYPSVAELPNTCTLDSALTHIIKLRFCPEGWISRKKALLLLPPRQSEVMEIALAQMRAVGLVAVFAASNDEDVRLAQRLAAQYAGIPVLDFAQQVAPKPAPRRGIVPFLRRKLRTL